MRNCARLILASTCLLPLPAVSDDLKSWGASGEWEVMVDPDAGNGCLMQKVFEDGVRIRFGNVPIRNGGFLSAFSREWLDVEVGSTATVKFVFDGARFSGDVDMQRDEDWLGGYAYFDNPELIKEFSKKLTMTIIGPKGGTFTFDLKGSSKALAAVDQCQKAQS